MIKQRTPHDCGVCTIAMAVERSYDDVMDIALRTGAFDPVKGMRSEYRVLEEFGLEQMKDFRMLHRGVLSPEFFLHFAWGRRAVLAVPSLNFEDGFHSVYWTGNNLLDPCSGKTYSAWEQLRPDEIIVFHEARG